MTDEIFFEKFISSIGAELNSYEKFIKLYSPQLAANFNSFTCLYPDENRLSSVIAMMLDINGSHGQGDIFLKKFIEKIKSINCDCLHKYNFSGKELVLDVESLITNAKKPKLEVVTNYIEQNSRRIDILLHFDIIDEKGFGLAIENKPWAIDQKNQIFDYCAYMEKIYQKNYMLIYLNGSGDIPSQYSINKDERIKKEKNYNLISISYELIRDWCIDCSEKTKSVKVKLFIEQFGEYINNIFCSGGSEMKKELVVERSTTKENILAAASIGIYWPNITEKLICELVKLVFEEIRNYDYVPGVVDFQLEASYSNFYYKREHWKLYNFQFCFEKKNARDFFYGICKFDEKTVCDNEIFNEKGKDIFGQGSSSQWWPWYQNFNDIYWDWSINAEPWSGIKKDGETVKIVTEKLKKMIEAFSQHIEELEKLNQ